MTGDDTLFLYKLSIDLGESRNVRHHFFFFQAEDGIRDKLVTGVQTCALPISLTADALRPPQSCRFPISTPFRLKTQTISRSLATTRGALKGAIRLPAPRNSVWILACQACFLPSSRAVPFLAVSSPRLTPRKRKPCPAFTMSSNSKPAVAALPPLAESLFLLTIPGPPSRAAKLSQ